MQPFPCPCACSLRRPLAQRYKASNSFTNNEELLAEMVCIPFQLICINIKCVEDEKDGEELTNDGKEHFKPSRDNRQIDQYDRKNI
jgi:hypothetical protein